jgi:hypothetical protein
MSPDMLAHLGTVLHNWAAARRTAVSPRDADAGLIRRLDKWRERFDAGPDRLGECVDELMTNDGLRRALEDARG